MKKMVLFVCGVLCVAATGFAKGQPNQPNLVSCQNDRGTVELEYAASSLSGEPQFLLTIDGEQVFPPTTPPSIPQTEELLRIETEETVFGTFVHALDATRTPLDEPTDVYGFFLPSVTVNQGQRVEFQSVILIGSIGGFIPPRVPAQRIDQAIEVTCEGSVVVF
jgi:hypothetical protein